MTKDYQEIRKIFYNDLANKLLETIKSKFDAESAEVILFHRRDRQFYHLLSETKIPVPEEDIKLQQQANDQYFQNISHIYTNDKGLPTGLALISTSIGALGYIVVKNMYKSTKGEPNHKECDELSDYGALYGTLVLRKFQQVVKQYINRTAGQDALHGYINNFIPFGKNPCISVFLDIRGFSNLMKERKEVEYVPFIQRFSEEVETIAKNHFGIVSGHFGGGMLITFNQVIYDDIDNESCFRAICTIKDIVTAFEKLVNEHFSDEIKKTYNESIQIGIGTSRGDAFFSTFGTSPCIYYTGIGEEISFAKKVENISGRELDFMSSKGKVFASDEIFKACQKIKENVIDFESINTSFPHQKDKEMIHHVKGVDKGKCPVSYKCLCCQPNKDVTDLSKNAIKGDAVKKSECRFEIALSFAGEYRNVVSNIADGLADKLDKNKVLYDKFHEAEFARPNLDLYLQDLYHNKSNLIVVFLGKYYNQKTWCGLEWRSIRDLLSQQTYDERIMFARIDDGEVNGVYGRLDGHITVNEKNINDTIEQILKRYRSL